MNNLYAHVPGTVRVPTYMQQAVHAALRPPSHSNITQHRAEQKQQFLFKFVPVCDGHKVQSDKKWSKSVRETPRI